jgi:hypothetical protein
MKRIKQDSFGKLIGRCGCMARFAATQLGRGAHTGQLREVGFLKFRQNIIINSERELFFIKIYVTDT